MKTARNDHLPPVLAAIVNQFSPDVPDDESRYVTPWAWDEAKQRFNDWADEHGEPRFGVRS